MQRRTNVNSKTYSYPVFTYTAMHLHTIICLTFAVFLHSYETGGTRPPSSILQIPNNDAQNTRDNNRSSSDAYIIVMGLSGSGKSSTIKRIIGAELPSSSSTDSIQEYIFPSPVPSLEISNARLHIIDTPGFGESDGIEADARLLASLRKFRRDHPELRSKYPTAILILSRFDDNRARGESSSFVKMLKAFDSIKEGFVPPPENGQSNVIFLMTRFMSQTKAVQRRPEERIKFFEQIIRDFTVFPVPIRVKVGENNGEEKGLEFVNGSFKLPNKESYPENIINEMIQIARQNRDPTGAAILENLLGEKSNLNVANVQIVTHALIDANSPEIRPIVNTLSGQSMAELETTEVNEALAKAYQTLPDYQKRTSPGLLQILQMAVQNFGIRKSEDVPKISTELVKLLRLIDLTEPAVAVLEKGLGIRVPELYIDFIVGYGYDVLKDNPIPTSPLDVDNLETAPSPLGYKIPVLLHCEMIEGKLDVFSFPKSYAEYVEERKRDLEMHENFNTSIFEGQAKEGQNINDEIGLSSFSAVREIHKFKLELKETLKFNSDFKDTVSALKPFDSASQESVKIWRSFFNTYGTHIVSSAFGGGAMISSVMAGEQLKYLISSPAGINEVKDVLLNFQNFRTSFSGSDQVTAYYRYQGGEAYQSMNQIKELSETERTRLLEEWKSSLLIKPVILQTKLSLRPLSTYVRLVRADIGDEVDRGIQLLLSGNLVYKRVKLPKATTGPEVTLPPRQVRPSPSPRAEYPLSDYTDRTENRLLPEPKCPPCPDLTCPSQAPPMHCSATPPTPVILQNCPETKQADNPKSKTVDPKMNLIGQSYDILHDTVLQISPFELTSEISVKIRTQNYTGEAGLSVKRTQDYFPYTVFEHHATRADYIVSRLRKLDKAAGIKMSTRISGDNLQRFGKKVKPGYNIQSNSNPWKPLTRYEEAKMLIATIELPKLYRGTNDNDNSVRMSQEFKNAVNTLQDYIGRIEQADCSVQNTWVNFFETYGTHVVTTACLGQSVITTVEGTGLVPAKTLQANPAINVTTINNMPTRNFMATWLHGDFTLTRISEYIKEIKRSLWVPADDAINAWIEGKLTHCDN